jgi:hypothetical protein
MPVQDCSESVLSAVKRIKGAFMRTTFIGLAMLALITTAAHPAEDELSANANLPGCKAILRGKLLSTDPLVYPMGRCGGILIGLGYATHHYGACVPDNATIGQIARIVVTYIERQPERWHEDFRALALEAMRDAWPCKQQ